MTPQDTKDEVSLVVNGSVYKGWTGVSVKIGIRAISGGFDLTVTDDWTPSKKAWPLAPGDKCTVKIGPDVAITGYVDDVEVSYDENQHSIRVSGRDAAADLVDCAAGSSPGHYSNLTLAKLASQFCKPFGISVVDNVGDTTVLPNSSVNIGETVFELLDKAARLRAVLLYSDGKGSLVLGKPGTVRCPTALVEGGNLVKATGRFSAKDRFSAYVVKSQLGGWNPNVPVETATGIIGKATDSGVSRYRPFEVNAEVTTDIAGAQRRANWEASTRRGKSQAITVTVEGHRQSDGSLWLPNFLVQVTAPWLGLSKATDLLICEVDYVQNDDEGTVTSLELMPADAMRVLKTDETASDLWKNFGQGGGN